ncbi:MAG TPA: OsmC family protein [Pseudolabrys sp.]|nr:OsmC family protein [Pseudolabrys sp.]
MTTMSVQLRSIPDTQAAVGWADGHTIVVDRPDGKAGGMGLGLNGGQLLGLAIGGCFCNDLHYVAHDMGVRLTSIAVDVTVDFEGNPLIAKKAAVHVAVTAADAGADVASVVRRAQEISAVSNSIKRGIPVDFLAHR